MLQIENLYAGFRQNQSRLSAVRDLSLSLQRGETLGIAGESGCGKSVTAYSIMRLLKTPGEIFAGKIIFKNRDLLSLPERSMRAIRGREISMIFQEAGAALDPCFTAGAHIEEALTAHRNLTKEELKSQAITLIDSMKIPDPAKIYSCYPHELSGGMQQRIIIASALACSPELLIADEPTTALDVTVQSQILSLIQTTVTERKMSLIFISHDLGITANLCDKTAVMYAGEIVEYGKSSTLFSDPVHPYTQALLESMPVINEKRHRLKTIPGTVPPAGTEFSGCAFYERCSYRTKECLNGKIKLEAKKGEHLARCINR